MASFLSEFDRLFASRLAQRATTFRQIFERLEARKSGDFLIVETGTLRRAGNWAGDGQSTLLFDRFVDVHGGHVVSVDKDAAACAESRRVVSDRTQVVCCDSVQFFWRFSPERTIDLVYLDSFDLDWNDPLPSSLHHLKELCVLLPKLRPGALIVVDDNANGRGKGELIRQLMESMGVEPVFDEHQIGWELQAPDHLQRTLLGNAETQPLRWSTVQTHPGEP
jgi:hypothetical protein